MQMIPLSVMFVMELVLLATLLFIGYFVYKNAKRVSKTSEMFESKESDIIDLYNSLEMMIKEIEKQNEDMMLEIRMEKEQIRKWYDELATGRIQEKKTYDIAEKKIANEKVLLAERPIERLIEKPIEKSIEKPLYMRDIKHSDMKKIKVRTLYNKGMTIEEIARDINIGKGEVELILNFKNKIV